MVRTIAERASMLQVVGCTAGDDDATSLLHLTRLQRCSVAGDVQDAGSDGAEQKSSDR
jgi:hypothetical protein